MSDKRKTKKFEENVFAEAEEMAKRVEDIETEKETIEQEEVTEVVDKPIKESEPIVEKNTLQQDCEIRIRKQLHQKNLRR